MSGSESLPLLTRLREARLPFAIEAHCLNVDIEDDGPMVCCVAGDPTAQLDQLHALFVLATTGPGRENGVAFVEAYAVGRILFDDDTAPKEVCVRVDRDGSFQFQYLSPNGIRYGSRIQDMGSRSTPVSQVADGRLMLIGEGLVGEECATESAIDIISREA